VDKAQKCDKRFSLIKKLLIILYYFAHLHLSISNFMMKSIGSIGLLILSNTFMTFAWYGHLKFRELKWFETLGLLSIILISWGIAFFEYCFQVPANRIGFTGNGGPFTLVQLKVIQEVVSITVFTIFTLLVFKTESFRMNHLIGFVFLILAVYFIFKAD
jgi:uncharacterized protein (DUF486 family)